MKKILQGFKRIFQKKDPHCSKAYICDPSKAVRCRKEGCWILHKGPCKCTGKKRYAKLDENGKPIVATDMDLWNAEYYDYVIAMRDQTKSDF